MVERLPDARRVVSREVSGLRIGNNDALTAPGSPATPNGPGAPASQPTADDVPMADHRHLVGGQSGDTSGGWTMAKSSRDGWV